MHKDVSMLNQNLLQELIKWHTQIQLQDRRNGMTVLTCIQIEFWNLGCGCRSRMDPAHDCVKW